MRKLLLVFMVLVSMQCFSYETLKKGYLYRSDFHEKGGDFIEKVLQNENVEIVAFGGDGKYYLITKPKQELTRNEKIIKLSELLGISLMRAELIYNKEVKK